MKDRIQSVIGYHERTKHHPHRYARSPGFLDWANEPDPFRRFDGASLLPLSLGKADPKAEYRKLYARTRNSSIPFSLESISTFLSLSLGLSAWKSYKGTTWALRMNPSSGNLHPTESYLILGPLPEKGDRGAVYHYSPYLHALELRAAFDPAFWLPIAEHFGREGFLMGLTSIYWRESWKYGERAFRYCNHDVGHAMAALSFAGNLLGWKVTYLDALSDEDAAALLGLRRTKWIRFEEENPEVLLFVHPDSERDVPRDMPPEIIRRFGSLSYSGEPNRLSEDHRNWEVIEEASAAAEKTRVPEMKQLYRESPLFGRRMPAEEAASIIRRRRSALAFDGETAMTREAFLGMLDKTLPRGNAAPFDLGLGEPSVHLFIFLHRVSGLDRGLYFLPRNDRHLEKLKRSCRPEFLWEEVKGPSDMPGLYLLKRGDFRNEGATAG